MHLGHAEHPADSKATVEYNRELKMCQLRSTSEAQPCLEVCLRLVVTPDMYPGVATDQLGKNRCLIHSIACGKQPAEVTHSVINSPVLDLGVGRVAFDL